MSKHPPTLSPVDYDAWNRGYMPPSEHILIDALSYRGARVVMASDLGPSAWWIVMRGDTKRDPKIMRQIYRLLAEMEDMAAAETSPEPEADAPENEAREGEGAAGSEVEPPPILLKAPSHDRTGIPTIHHCGHLRGRSHGCGD